MLAAPGGRGRAISDYGNTRDASLAGAASARSEQRLAARPTSSPRTPVPTTAPTFRFETPSSAGSHRAAETVDLGTIGRPSAASGTAKHLSPASSPAPVRRQKSTSALSTETGSGSASPEEVQVIARQASFSGTSQYAQGGTSTPSLLSANRSPDSPDESFGAPTERSLASPMLDDAGTGGAGGKSKRGFVRGLFGASRVK